MKNCLVKKFAHCCSLNIDDGEAAMNGFINFSHNVVFTKIDIL